MPVTHLRMPLIIDMKTDPYENAMLGGSIHYYPWLADRAHRIGPSVLSVGAYLQTYKEFPPRQRPATFSIDQVIEKLMLAPRESEPERSDSNEPSHHLGSGRGLPDHL